ncbi:translation initiation factor eIF-2 beta subunit [Coemansia javaensis]|uniref:Translation initiation factor eIF-2 beta subunit n=1 Tax=Coemansia javaensis TaxID=2761396 RepID=A0A9W8HJA0_9FUNG|nr:translation initiation factor eIF-2 beta subunit [Coemansia javaensis]
MGDDEIPRKLDALTLNEADEDTFDAGAKKKKTKKVVPAAVLDDAANDIGGADGANDDDDDLAAFAGMKKKKKSKAKVSFGDEDGAEGAADEDGAAANEDDADLLDMSAIKKKKKKSKKNLAAFEAELGGDEAVAQRAPVDRAGEPWIGSDRDYTYAELLGRFYKILRENNPDATGEKPKYTMVPPQVLPEGRKRTMFANVLDIARRMRRDKDHLILFLYAELGTSGSIDSEGRMLIKGRFKQKQIESVLRHYIAEYVACKTCKSAETTMSKDKALRFITCSSCGSTRTVAAIKTGFQAATKDKRRAERAAT